jgi:hypothetical protein
LLKELISRHLLWLASQSQISSSFVEEDESEDFLQSTGDSWDFGTIKSSSKKNSAEHLELPILPKVIDHKFNIPSPPPMKPSKFSLMDAIVSPTLKDFEGKISSIQVCFIVTIFSYLALSSGKSHSGNRRNQSWRNG